MNISKRALVAQLDRALDYESRGQGFESSRAHHNLLFIINYLEELILNNTQRLLSFDTVKGVKDELCT